MGERLQDSPDWIYLLRDVQEHYRRSSAGGSSPIRAHQHSVRTAIGRVIEANPPLADLPPEDKPVTRHLARALDAGRHGCMGEVVRTLDRVIHRLSWLHGYETVPRGLSDRFAFAEIAGPIGPVRTDELKLGLVLFGPKCTYPAHKHLGVTESYFVLAGAVSQNDQGVFVPGAMIFNPPDHVHRITVCSREPALLGYVWNGPRENLTSPVREFQ